MTTMIGKDPGEGGEVLDGMAEGENTSNLAANLIHVSTSTDGSASFQVGRRHSPRDGFVNPLSLVPNGVPHPRSVDPGGVSDDPADVGNGRRSDRRALAIPRTDLQARLRRSQERGQPFPGRTESGEESRDREDASQCSLYIADI